MDLQRIAEEDVGEVAAQVRALPEGEARDLLLHLLAEQRAAIVDRYRQALARALAPAGVGGWSEDVRRALHRALHGFTEAERRWAERRRTGLSDEELRTAIAYEFGIEGGGGGPGERWQWHKGGKDPQVAISKTGKYVGSGAKGGPDVEVFLKGKKLLAAVRELLGIGTAPATPQRAAVSSTGKAPHAKPRPAAPNPTGGTAHTAKRRWGGRPPARIASREEIHAALAELPADKVAARKADSAEHIEALRAERKTATGDNAAFLDREIAALQAVLDFAPAAPGPAAPPADALERQLRDLLMPALPLGSGKAVEQIRADLEPLAEKAIDLAQRLATDLEAELTPDWTDDKGIVRSVVRSAVAEAEWPDEDAAVDAIMDLLESRHSPTALDRAVHEFDDEPIGILLDRDQEDPLYQAKEAFRAFYREGKADGAFGEGDTVLTVWRAFETEGPEAYRHAEDGTRLHERAVQVELAGEDDDGDYRSLSSFLRSIPRDLWGQVRRLRPDEEAEIAGRAVVMREAQEPFDKGDLQIPLDPADFPEMSLKVGTEGRRMTLREWVERHPFAYADAARLEVLYLGQRTAAAGEIVERCEPGAPCATDQHPDLYQPAAALRRSALPAPASAPDGADAAAETKAPAPSCDTSGKRKLWRYSLVLNGVWGRNRTSKFEVVRLLDADRDAPRSLEELMRLRQTKLQEIKFKHGLVRLVKDPIEVDCRDGFTSVSFTLGAGTMLHEERIGAT